MRYYVTREFIGGLLAGITITQCLNYAPPVGFVCNHPIGGSPYRIVSVIPVE